ncbi:MAG: MmcQ/YjbR family DNA-binding protein [Treponema sp.]|nr:MmcQ/YjbR family DNA-binding protein [Treponema sp.]
MDFSYILHTSVPAQDRLIEFGFEKQQNSFLLKKDLDSDFYAKVIISESNISVDVIENETNEKFILLDVKKSNGRFVCSLREKIYALMDQIRKKCFFCEDIKEQYVLWLENNFCIKGEFPWDGEPDYEVFRCPNKKWFALVMKIPLNRLGFETDEKVFIVNLKAESVSSLIDNKSVFPAWHMNKKYWVTVLLTSVSDFNSLCDLTRKSYELVMGK